MQSNAFVQVIFILLVGSLPAIIVSGCAESGKRSIIHPSDPLIQYWGRWDDSSADARVANWGPVGLKVSFEGTSVTILLSDEQLSPEQLGGTGNYYQYAIDDGPFTVLPSSAQTEYVLAEDLTDATHTLFLVRRTESMYGKTVFRGFRLDEGKTLLSPPPWPKRRIEILGDSISAGLANENTGWYNNAAQNGYMAFGPQVARLLDAEWRVAARGGGSFYNDYWLPMPVFFEKTFGPLELQHNPDGSNPDWDFAAWQPDVFILALGTNDYSVENVPTIEESAYVGRYRQFLGKLRAWYPDAAIFALAPFKEGAPWDECRAYIEKAVAGMSDSNMWAVNPVGNGSTDKWLTYPADFLPGDEYHPTIAGHTIIAQKLSETIADKMGW